MHGTPTKPIGVPGLIELQMDLGDWKSVAEELHNRLEQEHATRHVMERERNAWRRYHENLLASYDEKCKRVHSQANLLRAVEDQGERDIEVTRYLFGIAQFASGEERLAFIEANPWVDGQCDKENDEHSEGVAYQTIGAEGGTASAG